MGEAGHTQSDDVELSNELLRVKVFRALCSISRNFGIEIGQVLAAALVKAVEDLNRVVRMREKGSAEVGACSGHRDEGRPSIQCQFVVLLRGLSEVKSDRREVGDYFPEHLKGQILDSYSLRLLRRF